MTEELQFRIEVVTASELTRLSICGNFQSEKWSLPSAVELSYTEASGNNEGSTTWRSPQLSIPAARLPLRIKFVANGHRSSPNTRPLIWDSRSRVYASVPADGLILCEFEPTPDSSDTGWVTADGVGAFQLRVGQPPGSSEALVTLEPHMGHTPEEVDVMLWEAKPHDPAVPQGKVLARVGEHITTDSTTATPTTSHTSTSANGTAGGAGGAQAGGMQQAGAHTAVAVAPSSCTYLLNSQSVSALAFRVDVVSRRDGALLARCYVEPATLQSLEGSISAALVTPDLRHAGTFRASFLVVAALPHPANNLGNLQRTRWVPGGRTLDIGHRGSGASKVQGHNVRENTLLSFQKAAVNHSDFIEFDVHVTADGECVVFHDFLVPIRLGATEVVRLPIPTLTYEQLKSHDFTQWMVGPNEDAPCKDALDEEKQRRRGTLQRSMTSAEDLFRSIFKPQFQGATAAAPQRASSSGPSTGPGSNHAAMTAAAAASTASTTTTVPLVGGIAAGLAGTGGAAGVSASRWFLTDRIASLREAFRRTPHWLGFNIELKYPTGMEAQWRPSAAPGPRSQIWPAPPPLSLFLLSYFCCPTFVVRLFPSPSPARYPTVMEVAAMRAQFYSRNHFVDAVLRVALEEGAGRRVIFSTFDPDCATLLSLKQPRFPVLFLTCGGTKLFSDPRMNSVDAALQFALASRLQGVVAEVSSVLGRLHESVAEFHRHSLFLYTWGEANNDYHSYMAQKEAGIDAIIMDDIEKMAKRTNKRSSLFNNKAMRSPASSAQDLGRIASGPVSMGSIDRASSNLNMLSISALSPIGSPANAELGSLGGMPPLALSIGSPPTRGGPGSNVLGLAAGLTSPRIGTKVSNGSLEPHSSSGGLPAVHEHFPSK